MKSIQRVRDKIKLEIYLVDRLEYLNLVGDRQLNECDSCLRREENLKAIRNKMNKVYWEKEDVYKRSVCSWALKYRETLKL